MAMRGGPRLQVGSAAWIAEERQSALNIAQSEIEEFAFSARNEIDWLNEHMAEIFSENQTNVAELFKTPGRLRGKTPRTARKAETASVRVPLSDVFSANPKGAPNPFALSNLSQPRSPPFRIAEDIPDRPVSHRESPAKPAVVHPPHRVESRAAISLADSGYHGSQSQDTAPFEQFDKDIEMSDAPQRDLPTSDPVFPPPGALPEQRRPSAASVEQQSPPADRCQTQEGTADLPAKVAPTPSSAIVQQSSPFASRARLPILSPRSPSPKTTSSPLRHSPHKSSPPQKSSSPEKPRPASPHKGFPQPAKDLKDTVHQGGDVGDDVAEADEVRSPSDSSSPIRPIVRKSSLNFASLPAREPLASKKSLGGARISRTSHLDFNRQSYYGRQTGGKSLGSAIRQEPPEDDHDEMDVDDEVTTRHEDMDAKLAAHSKTYTQRLQDQISMLGKAQSIGPRPSKSLANLLPSQPSAPAAQSQSQSQPAPEASKPSPKPKHSVPAPGAFPEDDEDDWISPPTDTAAATSNPQPLSSEAHHSDVAGDLGGERTTGNSGFVLPKSRPASPAKTPFMPEHTPKHGKSASVPVLPTTDQLDADQEDVSLKKTVSVSNPALSTVPEDEFSSSPPKSPSRGFRDSPLKQVKNKLSSLLKSSKGLIASSAAISAEGKSSLLQSPSTTRLGYHAETSVESFKTAENVMYPDLSQQVSAASAPLSPGRTNGSRKTRASAERERQEAKEREKEEKEREREKEREMKEAKRLAEQMEKLEKAREKEREKARVFNQEQEKIAAMERQVAAQKEQERAAQAQPQPQPQAQDTRTPGPAPKNAVKSAGKTARTTPRKTNGKSTAAPSDDLDQEMTDVTTTVAPQSIPRPTTASSVRTTQTIKRPVKPTKETLAKSKQAPTLIRVNTTSSQQTQFHPSNSVLAATLHDTLGQQPGSAKPMNGKASQNSLHGKPSLRSLNSSVSSTGRPKALELAAKRKEQEEREAQRRRETKLEIERKRAALEEERRQEQQRRLETERQKEEERKAAQAKKAAIEKAKQTRAPPPAVRSQPNGPPEYSMADKGPARPPSRLGSTMHQEGRLVNTVLSSTAKGPSKRPLQQDAGEESSRAQQQRAAPSFPAKEAKRMRMSEEFDEDIDMAESHNNQRIIKEPPVRPSAGFKKDLPTKSMFANGSSNAPPPSSASRELFKSTVMAAQQSSHAKAGHPLDMAQLSKGAIPFASSNASQAGPSHHKTPARPAAAGGGGANPKSAKSAARSSPRFPNGETIELPDIQTDDDSDEDDGGHVAVAAWANSPALRAALLAQERVDPMQVFGPPAPLNMEEVFSKSKDRWHKFRARTSSANWSGTDRLTEEDIRKDLAARDKMRREGGWSYELGRELS
ncbi:uncharacterized protein THITE_2122802 [Thermothielavioides terrestris NRRL 8126]|uniref:Inner centromere protein ARK-binding domain-containing protein n=1 Tax=Thermothielavioides terrestris (strain ATCC 38088 / NRRL 8126) TaxID=578455 RepID=G2RE88_THETT|nr:uncharacterized protein THITE_2122802 [Thermothielavioides terrestris NRRL 8126]AEO70917.1 hypothetical protein THITE_2122802 [Thermothielavioides terrestris NRRL 8126]